VPVRKVKNGWKVENAPTVHKTRAAAERQLKAIKANQAKRKR